MHTETGGVKRYGRQHKALWLTYYSNCWGCAAGQLARHNIHACTTVVVGTSTNLPQVDRPGGPGAWCTSKAVHVGGLGKTNMTLERRVLLLLYLLLYLLGIRWCCCWCRCWDWSKTKTWSGERGRFQNYWDFQHRENSADKILRCWAWLWYHTCPDIFFVQIFNRISVRQSSSVGRVSCHTETQYSETEGSMDLALMLLPVATTCCCWELATGHLPSLGMTITGIKPLSQVDERARCEVCTTRERAWCNRKNGRQMCAVAAVCCCGCCACCCYCFSFWWD